ncbi:hypothetical protein MSG28_006746 [Choristoneura fumiferana]|uniref:Uncharacterized protein n=1 Tax=Choristoneura fumiferana TaxID=7141 RepID=A0ACC0JL62_CHOFU|nr:hypothetical protein MSG28_006746 [Choristoneura fumiferana]
MPKLGDELEDSLFEDQVYQVEDEGLNKDAMTGAEITMENKEEEIPPELDGSIAEILGADPTAITQFSDDIHKDLACSMNPEIKAAVTETVIKRDKGIEMRQKQLGGAIAGLAGVISKELLAKDKNSERVKQLMDVCRILCDIQHAESVIRRNFAIFSIKKDLKEHLVNTKIDKFLFGEDLAEALRTAKALTKSGTELKVRSQVKPVKPPNSHHLNYKAPAPARRQQGPPRSREPANQMTSAGPHQRYNRAPTHAHSSKPLQHPAKQTRRR